MLSVQFLSSRWRGQGENCKNGAYDLKKEEPLYPEDAIILIDERTSDFQPECPLFSSELYSPMP